MAHLTLFAFAPGHSRWHRLDPRFKLVLVLGYCSTLMASGFGGLALASLVLITTAAQVRLPIRSLGWELRWFYLLLALILLARSFSTPGHVIYALGSATITAEGVQTALLMCWRLVLILVISLVLMRVTRPNQVRQALAWYLSRLHIPGAYRISTMLALLMRFIPLIFSTLHETDQAQKARAIANRKNPVYRISKLTIPMLRRVILQGDRLALAMTARCYDDLLPIYLPAPPRTDWNWVAGAAFFLPIFLLI